MKLNKLLAGLGATILTAALAITVSAADRHRIQIKNSFRRILCDRIRRIIVQHEDRKDPSDDLHQTARISLRVEKILLHGNRMLLRFQKFLRGIC